MTSKVLVQLPTVPFPQGKKSAPELMTLPTKNEGTAQIRQQPTVPGDRTAQLEQNMKFLQEQHQITLVALHQEVEALRQKNRDLQFQLVFTKNTNCTTQSSPSSEEDSSNGFVKTMGSPLCVNETPLQVELLEKELDETKVWLNDSEKHNHRLVEMIDKLNKKLQQMKRRKERMEMADVRVQARETSDAVTSDLSTRLEQAEALVKRLQRKNEDQQKQIATMKVSSMYYTGNRNEIGRSRGHNNGHHNRGSRGNGGHGPHFHKFPSLQTQSYWYSSSRGNHSFVYGTEYDRNGRRRQNKQQDREGTADGTVLPQLCNSNGKGEFLSRPRFCQWLIRAGAYHEESPDYGRERDHRKYKGQKSQRDTTDTQEHRRDDKDGKDQQQQQQQQQQQPQQSSSSASNSKQSSRKQ